MYLLCLSPLCLKLLLKPLEGKLLAEPLQPASPNPSMARRYGPASSLCLMRTPCAQSTTRVLQPDRSWTG